MTNASIQTLSDLRRITGSQASHKVSIYVPVDAAPAERHASDLRLRGAFDRVEERLRARGVATEEIEARRKLLEQARPTLDDLHPSERTVAWFGDDAGWTCVPLVEALPERIAVAGEFVLRPLIRVLRRERGFLVVRASASEVAVFEGDARELRPIEITGMPTTLEEALGSDIEGQGVNYRSDKPVPGRSANAPIYHSHGGAREERQLDRERFFQVVTQGLASAWSTEERPIVLAAEVRTAAEVRGQIELPNLLDEEIRGNLEDAPLEELHRRAQDVVRSSVEEWKRSDLAAEYETARNTGKFVDGDFDAVGEAAVAGRIRRLWIEERTRLPGRFDWQTGRLADAQQEDDDAFDGLVAQVLERGGDVYVVDEGDTPAGASYSAELR